MPGFWFQYYFYSHQSNIKEKERALGKIMSMERLWQDWINEFWKESFFWKWEITVYAKEAIIIFSISTKKQDPWISAQTYVIIFQLYIWQHRIQAWLEEEILTLTLIIRSLFHMCCNFYFISIDFFVFFRCIGSEAIVCFISFFF